MTYIIDRIESGIAVCESLENGEKLEIAISNLPKEAKESDAIRESGDGYIIDAALTSQRMADLSKRLNRLFNKHKP